MKSCKNYFGFNCINGKCPKALAEQYPWYELGHFKNCGDCPYNYGCQSCIDFDCKNRREPFEE